MERKDRARSGPRAYGLMMLVTASLGCAPMAMATPEKPNVKIGYASMSGAFGALWIAEAKNYFKEEGLNVELLYTQTTLGLQALSSGHVDAMATGCAEFFEANRKGYENRLVINFVEGNIYTLVGAKSITKPQDLIGKAVAVNSLGDTSYLSVRYALRRAGVDPGQVTYMEIGSTPERFSALSRGAIAGAVQAVSLRPLIQKTGLNVLIDLHDLKIPSCLGAFGLKAESIKKYPQTVEAIVRSLVKANAYFSAGPPDETKRIFAKYMRLAPDNENLVMGWNFFSKEGHSRTPKMTVVQARTVMDMMAEHDPSWKSENAERYLDLSFMSKLEVSGYLEKVYSDIQRKPAK